MATQEEWEFRIAKLALEPGDVLVVSFPRKLFGENIERNRRYLEKVLPDGIEIIFKEDDIDFSVLTRSQIEAAKEPGAFVRRLNGMTGILGDRPSQIIIDDPHKR